MYIDTFPLGSLPRRAAEHATPARDPTPRERTKFGPCRSKSAECGRPAHRTHFECAKQQQNREVFQYLRAGLSVLSRQFTSNLSPAVFLLHVLASDRPVPVIAPLRLVPACLTPKRRGGKWPEIPTGVGLHRPHTTWSWTNVDEIGTIRRGGTEEVPRLGSARDLEVRLRQVTFCQRHRCSSTSKLCAGDAGRILADAPGASGPFFHPPPEDRAPPKLAYQMYPRHV